jgi:hypothetical protein
LALPRDEDICPLPVSQAFDLIAPYKELLLEKETVTGNELDDLIRSMRPGIEFPSKSTGDK